MSVLLTLYATFVFLGTAVLLAWPVTVLRNDVIQAKWLGRGRDGAALAITLLVWGGLSFLATVLFVQVSLHNLWNLVPIAFLVLIASAVIVAVIVRQRRMNSLKVRVERAKRGGQLKELLQLYMQAGQFDKLQAELRAAMPEWPVGEALVKTTAELFQLQRGAVIAKEAGVSKVIISGIEADMRCLFDVLLSSADRIARVSAQYNERTTTDNRSRQHPGFQDALEVGEGTATWQSQYPSGLPQRVQQDLQLQAKQFDEILAVVRDAREELALATIGNGRRTDSDEATQRLKETAKLAQNSW